MGVLGLSQPLNGTVWFRLTALHDRTPAQAVLAALWQSVQDELHALDVNMVAVLATRNWVERYINPLGFRFDEDIITLRRDGDVLPAPRPSPFQLRLFSSADLEAVIRVDHRAFMPPWQLAPEELAQAARIAASYTVALDGEQIIGYQICTLYRDGAHLARLAVSPDYQRRGIGSLLLHDVLQRFFKRRVYTMTVNTQAGNVNSQHLYHQFGFQRNGYDLPVWSLRL